MKKLIVTIIVALVAICYASAQSTTEGVSSIALPKGKSVISGTVGFYPWSSGITFPPTAVSYEYMVAEFGKMWSVGVGAFGCLMGYNSGVGGCICAQGNIHLSPISPLDLYTGLYLGYTNVNVIGFGPDAIAIGAVIGARYFFSETFGANLQFVGPATINLGVSFKF